MQSASGDGGGVGWGAGEAVWIAEQIFGVTFRTFRRLSAVKHVPSRAGMEQVSSWTACHAAAHRVVFQYSRRWIRMWHSHEKTALERLNDRPLCRQWSPFNHGPCFLLAAVEPMCWRGMRALINAWRISLFFRWPPELYAIDCNSLNK